MLVKYEFSDGHTEEIQVADGSDLYFFYLLSARVKIDKPENIPTILIISEKMFTEHEGSSFYRKHKYTGFQVSLEEILENDEDIPDRHDYYADSEFKQVRKLALATLTEIQRRRFELYESGYTTREIAELEGVQQNAVMDSIKSAQKAIKKFLKKFE